MDTGIYVRDISSSEMLKENIEAGSISDLLCEIRTKKMRCDYLLHYHNGSLGEFKPSLTICDRDNVVFFNRTYVQRKIERFLKKKIEPKTNVIELDQPLNIKDLGKLVEDCEKSFNNVTARLLLANLPEENNFSKDKVRCRTPDSAFYGNYSISYLNKFF